jgi:hypothetical protein
MQAIMSYAQILEAYQGAAQLGMIQVQQKTAYRLSRIIDRLQSAVKTINKEKLALYKEHGEETKAGSGEYKIPDAKMEDFKNKVWEPFLEKTLEIEFMPVACNMFPSLPAAAIVAMGPMMIEEETIVTPR